MGMRKIIITEAHLKKLINTDVKEIGILKSDDFSRPNISDYLYKRIKQGKITNRFDLNLPYKNKTFEIPNEDSFILILYNNKDIPILGFEFEYSGDGSIEVLYIHGNKEIRGQEIGLKYMKN